MSDPVYQQKQYNRYKQLCEQLGVERQGERWRAHLRLLEHRVARYERALTVPELQAWWLERFTRDEIYELARGLA